MTAQMLGFIIARFCTSAFIAQNRLLPAVLSYGFQIILLKCA